MRKNHTFAALAAAALLALAGCGGIPRSGQVYDVSPAVAPSASIGLSAQPPADGATPAEILDGFLVACQAGFDDDFSVAREYLYAGAASSWNPLRQVKVFSDSQNIATSTTAEGGLRASVGTIGTLTSDGQFTESASTAIASADFSFAKNAQGQWRIVSLDDGVFLSAHLFSTVFSASPLYFLNSDSQTLVADLRYYPKSTFATNAIMGLLSGPSQWLTSGVHTAIPEGTTLLESVTVHDGLAVVNLSSEALAATGSQQANMIGQITTTLTTSSVIRQVQVKIENSILDPASGSDLPTYPYGSYPLGVVSLTGEIGTVSGGSVRKRGESQPWAGLLLTDLSASYSSRQDRFAGLTPDKRTLVSVDTSAPSSTNVLVGTSLVAPSYDSFGWIFDAESDNTGEVLVANPDTGEVERIRAGWLDGVKVRSIAVSRDGARLAVVGDLDGNVIIHVAAIQRGQGGHPRQIGEPMDIGQSLADASDVVWISSATLAVLGKTSAGSELSLYAVRVGGPSQRLVTPYAGTVAITGGRDEGSLTVLTDQGIAYAREGGAWRAVAEGVASIAYPG